MSLNIPLTINTRKTKDFLIKSVDKITLISLFIIFLLVVIKLILNYFKDQSGLNLILILAGFVILYFVYELLENFY